MAKKGTVSSKKKKNIKLSSWKLCVQTSSNNTIITLTDDTWNKISWGGTWLAWFKWSKESTPYAAEVLTRDILKEARDNYWLKEISIIFKGIWLARDWVFKAVNDLWGIDILLIKENTPVQFGGCRWYRPKRN